MSDPLQAAAMRLPGLDVRVLERCGSTNSFIFDHASDLGWPCLVAAEEQTAGRGRRGRRWHSAPGTGATFSLARLFNRPVRELAGISLVAGVVVAQTLRTLGVSQAQLKWPNDVVVADAKLGGILVESRKQGAAALVVVGIGINCRRDARIEARLRRRLTSLDRFVAAPDRNRLIVSIARRLLAALALFERHGLAPARREWQRLDANAGRMLRVRLPDGRVCSGVASGLSEDGGLRLRTRRGMRIVHSGSLRMPKVSP